MPPDCGDARSAGNAIELSSTDSDDVEALAAAFVPRLRHGAWSARGSRASMEDCHVGADTFVLPTAAMVAVPDTRAFYAVFDGHGGVTAAEFASRHLLDFTLAEASFPTHLSDALRASFLRLDEEFYAEVAAGRAAASGSTALAALVWGSQLLVANAGDSRAVLCRGGKAVTLSTDHKPATPAERARILDAGGAVCHEGRLNGELTVARSIGDFHLETLKVASPTVSFSGLAASGNSVTMPSPSGSSFTGPLTAEPEVVTHTLAVDDEFMLLGCDGLWDVLSSQMAVDFARQRLRLHNDPAACSRDLVERALELHTTDNVSVITVCFREGPPPPRRTHRQASVSMGRTLSKDALMLLNDALQPSACLPQICEQHTATAVRLNGL